MRLPRARDAKVPRSKVLGYLLSRAHPVGRLKAAFFCEFGFSAESWEALAEALAEHAASNEVAVSEKTEFGTRFAVDGPLNTPSGRHPVIRSVWFVELGQSTPRLVTAYPIRSRA
ncbi:MAG TPA: hypothetical protein VNA25_03020 [Phycisphaerae bacterium]|nr:hypothetical protein [Phycisphaerae bacterium]